MVTPKQGDNSVYFDLNDFKEFLDIEKVKEYTLEPVDDSGIKKLMITFYDYNGNVIEVKPDNENDKEEE